MCYCELKRRLVTVFGIFKSSTVVRSRTAIEEETTVMYVL